jgi:hypothetical protein
VVGEVTESDLMPREIEMRQCPCGRFMQFFMLSFRITRTWHIKVIDHEDASWASRIIALRLWLVFYRESVETRNTAFLRPQAFDDRISIPDPKPSCIFCH